MFGINDKTAFGFSDAVFIFSSGICLVEGNEIRKESVAASMMDMCFMGRLD